MDEAPAAQGSGAQDNESGAFTVTVKMGKSSVEIHSVASLDELFEGIEREFETLQRCGYTIECHERTLNLKDDGTFNLNFIRTNGKTVTVAADLTGSRDVKVSHIRSNSKLVFGDAGRVGIDNSKFPENQLDMAANLKALLFDLKTRVQNVSTDAGTADHTKRELISPIITYALAVVNAERRRVDTSVHPLLLCDKKWLEGRWSRGPLDFGIFVRDCIILVTEAKRNWLDEGIVQNLAQLCAKQEERAMADFTAKMDLLATRKRKLEESLDECRKKKSFGVVTTSTEYVFLQVEGNIVVKSDVFYIQLSRTVKSCVEEKAFEFQVERSLRMMVSMIQSAADEFKM